MQPRYFQRRFLFGYDPAEVDKALSELEQTAQQLAAEKREIEQRCQALEARLAEPNSFSASIIDVESAPLRRGVLGYRRADVRCVVGDLMRQLDQARQGQQDAVARLRATRAELEQWRSRQQQLETLALRAADEAARVEQRAAEQARALLAEADRTARRTVAEAKAEAERQLAEAKPQIERHHRELRRLATLQQELTGAIRGAMTEFERSLQGAVIPIEAAGITPTATVHDLNEQREPQARQEHGSDAGSGLPDRSSTDGADLRHRVRIVPIDDYAELARLVRRLGQVSGVEGVFVQSFDADVAELSVHLTPGVSIDQALEGLEGARLERSTDGHEEVAIVHLVTTAGDH